MIQLKDKRFIIIIIAFILLLVIGFFIIKNKKNIILSNPIKNEKIQTRLMTDKEKEARGLDKNQELQVVNDEGGLFIYKMVK